MLGKLKLHSVFLMKKVTVDGASGIVAYSNEVIVPVLNFDVMLGLNILVNCILKA